MPNALEQPVTIITGTRKGIGRQLAEFYLAQGHILVGCSRAASDLVHSHYHHFELDVADESAVKALFKFVKKDLGGRLDNLINNAGVASMNHALLTPVEIVDKLMNTNYKGTFLFSREAAKVMQKRNYGRIVNFTTVAVAFKLEGEAIYASSKAAVLSLTQVLAREFAEYGITVNAIGPTPVETDLIRNVPADKIADLLSRQAIPRFGQFNDVLNVINFYLQKDSDFVTGQNIYLGGV
jgi:3-oxoacyl-[acyl-carrier protein] reductase